MTETFTIAGYARISVDDELDQKNISIENQKAIIEDFVKTRFPGPLQTTLARLERFCFAMLDLAKRRGWE